MKIRFVTGWIGLLAWSAFAADFHVAVTGNDDNPGAKERPFASLEKARDAARAMRPATIWLHGGTYHLTQPFALTSKDSGEPAAPLVIRSVENETAVLCGARRLQSADFKPVTGAAATARLAPQARGRLLELDLAALGVTHRKPCPDLFTDNGGMVELFVGGKRMPLARYPNDGFMTMKRVLFNGGGQAERGRWGDKSLKQSKTGPGVFEYRDDRHARWVEAARRGALWVKGYWRCVWQNEAVRVAEIDTAKRTVTLAKAVPGGIGSKYARPEGDGAEKYWVLNLLEEVDQPGEWCVDFQDGKLYFLPPPGWERADILLADNAWPAVSLVNASHIELCGLTVEGGLDHGILVQGGAGNRISGCTVRNVSRYGVRVDGGLGHTVQSCDIYEVGAGGVWLGGGDENATPRVPACHRVVNCHIHHFGRIELVYAPGVNSGFTGGGGGGHHVAVGMKVEHNWIHDGPHAGVLYGSWDSVFAYNEVSAFCELSNDMGAFYCYDRFERSGNHRLYGNFVHSAAQGDGIYFDCDHHGTQVYSNIVCLCSTGKWGTAFLYKTGTQAQHPQPIFCSNNIAVASSGGFNFITPRPGYIANNVAVNCRKPYAWQEVKGGEFVRASSDLAFGANIAYDADPGFVNAAALDFALRPDARVFKDLPGFRAIPLDPIGLCVDEYRRSLPARAGAGRPTLPPVAAAARTWRIMPVGDSITEGGQTFACYRAPLLQKLTESGYRVEYVGSRGEGALRHEGYGGRNVEFLSTNVPPRFREHPADIVLLHCGHNHFVEEQPVPGILAATEKLIGALRATNPHVIVLLAQVIPSGKLPKYSYIPELNRELAGLAKRLDVVLVNQADGFDWKSDTIADKVHPNTQGAEKMAVRWFTALKPVLADTRRRNF